MLAINDPKLIPLRDAALDFYNDEGGPCGATFVVDGRHIQVTISEVVPNRLFSTEDTNSDVPVPHVSSSIVQSRCLVGQ